MLSRWFQCHDGRRWRLPTQIYGTRQKPNYHSGAGRQVDLSGRKPGELQGGLGPSGHANHPNHPPQYHHAEPTHIFVASRPQNVATAYQQRTRIRSGLVHVPSQHRPHEVRAGIFGGRGPALHYRCQDLEGHRGQGGVSSQFDLRGDGFSPAENHVETRGRSHDPIQRRRVIDGGRQFAGLSGGLEGPRWRILVHRQ